MRGVCCHEFATRTRNHDVASNDPHDLGVSAVEGRRRQRPQRFCGVCGISVFGGCALRDDADANGCGRDGDCRGDVVEKPRRLPSNPETRAEVAELGTRGAVLERHEEFDLPRRRMLDVDALAHTELHRGVVAPERRGDETEAF